MALESRYSAALFALATALLSPLAQGQEPRAPGLRWSLLTAPGEDDLDSDSLADPEGDHRIGLSAATLIEAEERPELELEPYADEWVFVPRVEVALLQAAPWSVDIEARCLNEVTEGSWATSALLAGPRVTLRAAGWRAQLSVLPSLRALREVEVERAAPTSSTDDRSVVRLVVGTDL